MKFYKVFKNQTEEFEAIEQGWSWLAFFFSGFWAYKEGLNRLAIVLVAIPFGIYVFQFFILLLTALFPYGTFLYSFLAFVQFIFSLSIFGCCIFTALKGAYYKEMELMKDGYEPVDMVLAMNGEEAIKEIKKKLSEQQ